MKHVTSYVLKRDLIDSFQITKYMKLNSML